MDILLQFIIRNKYHEIFNLKQPLKSLNITDG